MVNFEEREKWLTERFKIAKANRSEEEADDDDESEQMRLVDVLYVLHQHSKFDHELSLKQPDATINDRIALRNELIAIVERFEQIENDGLDKWDEDNPPVSYPEWLTLLDRQLAIFSLLLHPTVVNLVQYSPDETETLTDQKDWVVDDRAKVIAALTMTYAETANKAMNAITVAEASNQSPENLKDLYTAALPALQTAISILQKQGDGSDASQMAQELITRRDEVQGKLDALAPAAAASPPPSVPAPLPSSVQPATDNLEGAATSATMLPEHSKDGLNPDTADAEGVPSSGEALATPLAGKKHVRTIGTLTPSEDAMSVGSDFEDGDPILSGLFKRLLRAEKVHAEELIAKGELEEGEVADTESDGERIINVMIGLYRQSRAERGAYNLSLDCSEDGDPSVQAILSPPENSSALDKARLRIKARKLVSLACERVARLLKANKDPMAHSVWPFPEHFDDNSKCLQLLAVAGITEEAAVSPFSYEDASDDWETLGEHVKFLKLEQGLLYREVAKGVRSRDHHHISTLLDEANALARDPNVPLEKVHDAKSKAADALAKVSKSAHWNSEEKSKFAQRASLVVNQIRTCKELMEKREAAVWDARSNFLPDSVYTGYLKQREKQAIDHHAEPEISEEERLQDVLIVLQRHHLLDTWRVNNSNPLALGEETAQAARGRIALRQRLMDTIGNLADLSGTGDLWKPSHFPTASHISNLSEQLPLLNVLLDDSVKVVLSYSTEETELLYEHFRFVAAGLRRLRRTLLEMQDKNYKEPTAAHESADLADRLRGALAAKVLTETTAQAVETMLPIYDQFVQEEKECRANLPVSVSELRGNFVSQQQQLAAIMHLPLPLAYKADIFCRMATLNHATASLLQMQALGEDSIANVAEWEWKSVAPPVPKKRVGGEECRHNDAVEDCKHTRRMLADAESDDEDDTEESNVSAAVQAVLQFLDASIVRGCNDVGQRISVNGHELRSHKAASLGGSLLDVGRAINRIRLKGVRNEPLGIGEILDVFDRACSILADCQQLFEQDGDLFHCSDEELGEDVDDLLDVVMGEYEGAAAVAKSFGGVSDPSQPTSAENEVEKVEKAAKQLGEDLSAGSQLEGKEGARGSGLASKRLRDIIKSNLKTFKDAGNTVTVAEEENVNKALQLMSNLEENMATENPDLQAATENLKEQDKVISAVLDGKEGASRSRGLWGVLRTVVPKVKGAMIATSAVSAAQTKNIESIAKNAQKLSGLSDVVSALLAKNKQALADTQSQSASVKSKRDQELLQQQAKNQQATVNRLQEMYAYVEETMEFVSGGKAKSASQAIKTLRKLRSDIDIFLQENDDLSLNDSDIFHKYVNRIDFFLKKFIPPPSAAVSASFLPPLAGARKASVADQQMRSRPSSARVFVPPVENKEPMRVGVVPSVEAETAVWKSKHDGAADRFAPVRIPRRIEPVTVARVAYHIPANFDYRTKKIAAPSAAQWSALPTAAPTNGMIGLPQRSGSAPASQSTAFPLLPAAPLNSVGLGVSRPPVRLAPVLHHSEFNDFVSFNRSMLQSFR